jgi:hypothetical protein
MLSKLKGLALWAALLPAFWFVLNDSLEQMTRNDCTAGIAQACRSLK